MRNIKISINNKEQEEQKGKRKNADSPKNPEYDTAAARLERMRRARQAQNGSNGSQNGFSNTQKKSRRFNIKKIIKRLIILAIIAAVAGGGYFAYGRWQRLQKFNSSITSGNAQAKVCDNILDPKCWGEAFSPKLKQDNGITGVMIVGLDTRAAGGVNAGLMNTDSIIVALYDHNTKKTTLISFPRDLRIPFYINGNGPYYEKINAIYATGEARNDVDDGFDLLQENLERMLDKKIQYRVIVRLQGVEDAVNAVDGVEIDVPEYVKVKYPNDYPGQNGKPNSVWLYYEFEPGKQKMDGEHALVWARFRQVLNSAAYDLASDFSRARRQQEVIDAIKVKILADDNMSTLDKAEKYWNIFKTINKNVEANIGLEEIFAGFKLMDEADLDPINLVVDPNFGGLNQIVYHPPTSETGGYVIKFKDESFSAMRSYLDHIWENPVLYDEDAHILIENHLGRSYTSSDKAVSFQNDVYNGKVPITSNNLTMITSSQGTPSGVIIVDFSGGKMSGTTKYLADYFDASIIIEDPENHGYSQSGYEEDVKVIVNPPVEN